jgi:hypothetical protein
MSNTTITKQTAAEREAAEAASQLRKLIRRGTVYTVVRHVSSSGTERAISLHVVSGGDIRDVSHLVATATGMTIHPRERGLKVRGVGMDMAWHTVSVLSRVLYGDSYVIEQRSL